MISQNAGLVKLGLWLAAETAFPFSPLSGHPKFRLMACPRWHVVDAAMFERIRDDTDYNGPLTTAGR